MKRHHLVIQSVNNDTFLVCLSQDNLKLNANMVFTKLKKQIYRKYAERFEIDRKKRNQFILIQYEPKYII